MSGVDFNVSAVTDPVSAAIGFGANVVNLVTTLVADAQSPDAVKAAQAHERLAQWNELATAQANDDLNAERSFMERRMAQIGAK